MMPRRPARTLSMHNFRFVRHFEGDHTESLSGQREPFPADDIAEPNYEVYAFSLCRRPRGRYGLVPILVGRTVHHLREPKDRKGIFIRPGYSVRLAYVDDPEDPEDGEFLTGCYARVLHIRRWLLLLPLLLAALLLCLSLSLCSPSSSPDFLSGMTGTAGATPKVRGTALEGRQGWGDGGGDTGSLENEPAEDEGVLHINGSDSTDTLSTQQDVWYSDSVTGNVTYNFAIA